MVQLNNGRMHFIADEQTIADLNLLGKYKPNSIYSIFCKGKTKGGERLLEEMFRHPLTDAEAIKLRSNRFSRLQALELVFPFDPAAFQTAADYLGGGAPQGFLQTAFSVLRKKMMATLLRDEGFDMLQKGLQAAIDLLKKLRAFLKALPQEQHFPWFEKADQLKQVLFNRKLSWLNESLPAEMSVMRLAKLHHLLCHTMATEMDMLLQWVYELDVYISVSDVAREKKFSYAKPLPGTASVLKASGIWHPALEKAVPNPVLLNDASNLLFLTGANMAGKSTFMKSLGIAVYLAHMGFPVAAKEMEFSVRDGLYSSINIADNLNLGYSHFYAEVLRVKNAAEEVSRGKNLVVIFDELFKGTNVKDAYDATLSVTTAFSKYRNCVFLISTHIIEVGEALKDHSNIQFAFMPTIMNGHTPEYPYTLTGGITSDRQGWMIIRNEGIIEMIGGGGYS